MRLDVARVLAMVCLAAAGCGERQGGDADGGEREIPKAPDDSTGAAARQLESVAADLVEFLKGGDLPASVRFSDTVVLQVAPEGGGGHRSLSRSEALSRSNWSVVSEGQHYSLGAPPELTSLTTRADRHFNCMEYPLSTRSAELARLPHVGVKLEPEAVTSCLQTWNLTVVFDTTAGPPRVVAAVYDQWEW